MSYIHADLKLVSEIQAILEAKAVAREEELDEIYKQHTVRYNKAVEEHKASVAAYKAKEAAREAKIAALEQELDKVPLFNFRKSARLVGEIGDLEYVNTWPPAYLCTPWIPFVGTNAYRGLLKELAPIKALLEQYPDTVVQLDTKFL